MFLFLVVTGVALFLIIEERKGRRESKAIQLDLDMSRMLQELFEDPFITDSDWREWVSIFEYSDSEIRRMHKDLRPNRADFIRKMVFGENVTDS